MTKQHERTYWVPSGCKKLSTLWFQHSVYIVEHHGAQTRQQHRDACRLCSSWLRHHISATATVSRRPLPPGLGTQTPAHIKPASRASDWLPPTATRPFATSCRRHHHHCRFQGTKSHLNYILHKLPSTRHACAVAATCPHPHHASKHIAPAFQWAHAPLSIRAT